MLPTLNVWRPSLGMELRGKRLTFEPEAQLQLNRRTNGLAILNFELIYQTIRPGLQLYVVGRDLANYRQSTFRSLATSPTQVREVIYARLPGYVQVGVRYKFGE